MEGPRESDDSEEAMSRVAGYGGYDVRSGPLKDVNGVGLNASRRG